MFRYLESVIFKRFSNKIKIFKKKNYFLPPPGIAVKGPKITLLRVQLQKTLATHCGGSISI